MRPRVSVRGSGHFFQAPGNDHFLRSSNGDSPDWRVALQYWAAGNLSAVLDGYFHWLVESLGLTNQDPVEAMRQIGTTAADAVSVHTSRVQFDQLRVWPRRGSISLDAFNSPFRPFILVTTSIGQEGLEFHPYCHVVYHRNPPSNPVELEQREGRVHRYKGHAIRKNIALSLGLEELRGIYRLGGDA
jgi:hypothetical protein